MAEGPTDPGLRNNPFEPPRRAGSLGRLAHYEVEAFLGRGGFGTVVRAFDDKLHRPVAIKLLSTNFGPESSAYTRFLREARAAAMVRHDNVVQIYAVEEEPCPYIVLEYVPGESLQDRLDRDGRMEVADAVAVGIQVARGLAAAHEHGLVHRDIKPCNILVETVAGELRAKIADFGLALSKQDARLTQSGMVAGTPMYMAPEQASALAIDGRADLFSLGSVLYALLTGAAPFGDSNPSLVLGRIVGQEAKPIRERAPHVPLAVCRVVARMHAKNPEQRYATGREVADALTKALAEPDPPQAALPSRGALAPARRRGVRIALAALAAALAVGGLYFALRTPESKPNDGPKVTAPAAPADPFAGIATGWGPRKSLGPNINTAGREASPTLTGDTLCLVFSRDYRLYEARRKNANDEFDGAVPLFNDLKLRIDTVSMTADGLDIAFADRPDRPNNPGIVWISRRANLDAPFDPPERLPDNVNENEWSMAPVLAPDGLTLLIRTQRAGGPHPVSIAQFTRKDRSQPFKGPTYFSKVVNPVTNKIPEWIAPGGTRFLGSLNRNSVNTFELHDWDPTVGSFGAAKPFDPFPGKTIGRVSVSADGSAMYFHARENEAVNNLDLYVSRREAK